MIRRRPAALAAVGLLCVALAGCGAANPTPRPACPTAVPRGDEADRLLEGAGRAVVETSEGEFTIELYPEAAPLATANFVALAGCGFYDGLTFHRIVAGFVIQAGDPLTRTNRGQFEGIGTGGPAYRFEIEAPPAAYDYDRYVVAMANAGVPDSNGSQFFVALDDLDRRLARTYTILGKVVEGSEVVDRIGLVPTGPPPGNVPLEPVIIDTIRIEAPAS